MENVTLTPTTEMFANRCGYSDVHPFEIVRVVSDKTIEVRAMDTSKNKTKMDFHVGGFVANCSNQDEQDYDYFSNETYTVVRLRLRKDGRWYSKHGERHVIATTPYKFYDYNF